MKRYAYPERGCAACACTTTRGRHRPTRSSRAFVAGSPSARASWLSPGCTRARASSSRSERSRRRCRSASCSASTASTASGALRRRLASCAATRSPPGVTSGCTDHAGRGCCGPAKGCASSCGRRFRRSTTGQATEPGFREPSPRVSPTERGLRRAAFTHSSIAGRSRRRSASTRRSGGSASKRECACSHAGSKPGCRRSRVSACEHR